MRLNLLSYLAFLAAVSLAGCSSVTAPEGLAGNLRTLQSELASNRKNITATTTALRGLRDNRGADVSPQYKAFDGRLKTLEASVASTKAAGADSREKASTFFEKWDAQIATIEDANVAQASASRRAETQAEYEKIKGKISDLRDAFNPYYAALQDVRTSMSVDTTKQGAVSAKPAMDKAIRLEPDVLEKLDGLNKSLGTLSGSR